MSVGQSLLRDLQSTQAVGRLVINLDDVMTAEPGSPADLIVREGDALYIPRTAQEVMVLGEVQNATSHLYCLRETCRFYRADDRDCTFDAILADLTTARKEASERASDKSPRKDDRKDETAAAVARELDKFWKFHDIAFKGQDKLDNASIEGYAKQSGADMTKFAECMKSGKFKSFVEQDLKYGESVGVRSTPTFFINGEIVSGAVPIEQFSEIIDEHLAMAKK